MTKFLTKMAAIAMISGILGGCAYGGVAASGDKAVVLRNDAFLFGALRKAFVCKIGDAGLEGCSAGEAP